MSISATSGRKWAWRNLASILRFVTMRIRGHRPSESIMTTFMYGWMQLHGQVLCTCLDMFGEFFLGHSSSPYLSPSILRQWLLKALRCFLHGIIDVRYHVIQFMSVGFLVVGIYGMWCVAFFAFSFACTSMYQQLFRFDFLVVAQDSGIRWVHVQAPGAMFEMPVRWIFVY